MSPDEVWESLTVKQRSLAREIAMAAISGSDSTAGQVDAAKAVAFKLWSLLWDNDLVWDTEWPMTPGWYWTCIPDHETEYQRRMQPVEVKIAGTAPRTHVVYLRGGHFFYKSEQAKPVWWLPMPMPKV